MDARITVLVVSAALILSGCVDTYKTTGQGGFDGSYDEVIGYTGGIAVAESAPSPRNASDTINAGQPLLIKRGSAEVEVESGTLEAQLESLKSLVSQSGGTVENISYYQTQSRKSYRLDVRISPLRFDDFSSSLKTIGELKSLSTSSEDVTFQYIDLEARLTNLEAQKARLLQIYDRAETIENVVAIESEINRVQTEIDSASAQKRYLERQVERASLSINLYEEAPIVDQSLILPLNEAVNSLFQGLGFSILLISGLIGFGIPFLVIAILLIIVLAVIKRVFFRDFRIPFIGKKK